MPRRWKSSASWGGHGSDRSGHATWRYRSVKALTALGLAAGVLAAGVCVSLLGLGLLALLNP